MSSTTLDLQNLSDLSDLTMSGKEKNSEEVLFAAVLDAKKLAFQAARYAF